MTMNKMIAYCGLNCEKCDAYIATKNNDDELRKKVAEEWSKWNNAQITPEMINCDGCRVDGKKFAYCESLCPIKKCAEKYKFETCRDCGKLETCEKVSMVLNNSEEARDNLKK